MKKYILKPGVHQFAPNSAAVHTNDTLTDEEAEWYLQRYPHIAGLFVENNEDGKSESPEEAKPRKRRVRRVIGAPITNSVNQ